MALFTGFIPPTRENWELVVHLWQFFPLFSAIQWLTPWYPMGKTSITSRLNIPGKIGWATMEAPGFILLLYIVSTLPRDLGLKSLPWENWGLAGIFTIHYIYRALLAPLVLNPSMSPMHPFIWLSAFSWQVVTAISIGGWLGGYGPTSASYWAERRPTLLLGFVLWALSFAATIYHDDVLRDIRRDSTKITKQSSKSRDDKHSTSIHKRYEMPEAGLFHIILYPHYFCEWVEWVGFWMICGSNCVPARSFVINEFTSMLPRAVNGKAWYIEKFGAEKVGNRKAAIPGLL